MKDSYDGVGPRSDNNKNKYRHVQSDQRVRLNPANDRLTLVCGGFLSLPHLLLHHDAVEQWVGVPASHPHRNVPCHLSEPESSGGLQHVSPNLRSQTCVGFFFPVRDFTVNEPSSVTSRWTRTCCQAHGQPSNKPSEFY